MRSLQEDEDINPVTAPHVPSISEDDATLSLTTTAFSSQFSDAGSSYSEDNEIEVKARVPHSPLQSSQTCTPQLTASTSPLTLSASVSPTRTPNPASPRRHSISFSTSRSFFDNESSGLSSTGSQSGKPHVDGKAFFRQVRNRLSYEQFAVFLANVEEFNSHKQTKEEILRNANEIFGRDNKDLYAIFEGLITRNVR